LVNNTNYESPHYVLSSGLLFYFYRQLSFQLLVKTRLIMGVWTEGDTDIDVCFHFILYLQLRISVILFSHPVVKRREAYGVAAPAGTRAVWYDRRRATARNVQNEEEKNDGGNSRKGERDKRGRVAFDIVSQFLYTRFYLSLTNLAALKWFRWVREIPVLPVRVTFKRKYVCVCALIFFLSESLPCICFHWLNALHTFVGEMCTCARLSRECIFRSGNAV